ncbi:MAG TPA: ABC transporter permease subunit [Solirubrobacteraceae bacterium]|nr:ABC transporter permease subunit [Solirubrobacteraceae bacterium]
MSGVRIVAVFALRESVRRRVFLVVGLLTLGFLALYGLGTWQLFKSVDEFEPAIEGVEARTVAGATILGLAMFATLFLGTILAVFLTLGAVRGDAERGLLQPVLVRPLRRRTILAGRFAAAAGVCGAYVVAVFLAATVITWAFSDWWPDRTVQPAVQLAVAVAVLAALSLAGSVQLAATANGIAVFMIFGAGLTAGLLGQIGEALGSRTLDRVADIVSWVLPFEALYQAALSALTADTFGFTRLAINLGPFGGAEAANPGLWPWTVLYLALVGAAAAWAFGRRDL